MDRSSRNQSIFPQLKRHGSFVETDVLIYSGPLVFYANYPVRPASHTNIGQYWCAATTSVICNRSCMLPDYIESANERRYFTNAAVDVSPYRPAFVLCPLGKYNCFESFTVIMIRSRNLIFCSKLAHFTQKHLNRMIENEEKLNKHWSIYYPLSHIDRSHIPLSCIKIFIFLVDVLASLNRILFLD